MTLSQALFIKWLRIRQEGTWRWVYIQYNNRYNKQLPYNPDYIGWGFQKEGLELCYEAMKLLNEKTEDGWN